MGQQGRRTGAHVAVGVGRKRLGGAAGRCTQSVEVPQAPAVGAQLRVLVLARRKRVDLLDLEREQVEVAIARPGELAQRRDFTLEREHARVARGELRARDGGLGAGEAVEQLELRRCDRQLAVLVLSVEREQPRAEVA